MAVGGLCDVEAIEHGHGLIGFGASDMRLSAHVLHDAGDEFEHVAKVMCGGIRNIEYIESAEGLLRGDLGGINGGRGLDHIDDLAHLLLVGESDLDVSACLDRSQGDCVETLLLDAELVRRGGEVGELAVAGKIRNAAQRQPFGRGLQKYKHGRNGNVVLIGDRDQDVL